MKPRTQEDWERGQRLIEPVFGDLRPAQITFEHLDEFYAAALSAKGLNEAYRAIKHWRRLWKKMVAMGYAPPSDPSLAIRRKSPPPRSQVWREREVAHLVKTTIRSGYLGLACIIAVAWDTQFSPVDVRSLKRSNLKAYRGRTLFESVSREKTGRAIIGTVSRQTERLILGYLTTAEAHSADEFLFRNRSGLPYSKDTLGDDFRTVRSLAFPGDKRVLMDMRRSGAVEAAAGEVDPNALAAKMGNTINRSQQLQRTYQPVDLAAVRLADEARRRGRKRIREQD
jgi:integrase